MFLPSRPLHSKGEDHWNARRLIEAPAFSPMSFVGERKSVMRKFAIFVAACTLTVSVAFGANNPDQKEWIQLFNGKDLSDWAVKIRKSVV